MHIFKPHLLQNAKTGLFLLFLLSAVSLSQGLVSNDVTYAASCAGVETSILDCESGDEGVDGGMLGILLVVINFLATGVGIAVVGGIIWGGMVYASSNGDSGKSKQAVTVIVNSVVSLVVFIGMYGILQFLIPGGIFNDTSTLEVASNQRQKPGEDGGGGDNQNKHLPKPQQQTMEVTVIEHNQTEGDMLSIYWQADILIFSETSHSKIRAQSPGNFAWYFPADVHQAIGWNTDTMRLDGSSSKRSYRFHGSGEAEGWLNRNPPIPSPARFLHEVDLYSIKTSTPITVGATWWLNSWRNEEPRRQIVASTTIPVMKERFARVIERDRVGITGGDINHITYNFSNTFPGWNTAPSGGLDRMFWTKDNRVRFNGTSKGPITGVGSQLKHESLISDFTLHAEKQN